MSFNIGIAEDVKGRPRSPLDRAPTDSASISTPPNSSHAVRHAARSSVSRNSLATRDRCTPENCPRGRRKTENKQLQLSLTRRDRTAVPRRVVGITLWYAFNVGYNVYNKMVPRRGVSRRENESARRAAPRRSFPRRSTSRCSSR
jgi:hypothetical protein